MPVENFAELSSGRDAIALDDVAAPAVRRTIQLWRDLCAGRQFPSWTDIRPREFKSVLRHLFVARVVGNCHDYESRIAGDAHVQVFNLPAWPKRLSDVQSYAPTYGAMLKSLYDQTVRTREPHAIRSWLRRNGEMRPYLTSESAFLPLGPDAGTVDHLMVSTVYLSAWMKPPEPG
ncbi:MAG: PAS domain-containing protein [Rhizomicrobium sp.]|jgi:hypothetical protein